MDESEVLDWRVVRTWGHFTAGAVMEIGEPERALAAFLLATVRQWRSVGASLEQCIVKAGMENPIRDESAAATGGHRAADPVVLVALGRRVDQRPRPARATPGVSPLTEATTMKCRSGRHEWADGLDASRCCSPHWRREMRGRDREDDLDPLGRHVITAGGVVFVYGWVLSDFGRRLNEGLANIGPTRPGI
jgi:hypothetical protein